MNTKKSSLELMRIFSMLFIIIYHIIIHSKYSLVFFSGISTGGSRVLLVLLESIIVVHVDSFALLTGYFQSEKETRFSKIISIFNITWFYKLLCVLAIVILVNFFSFHNNVDMTFNKKLISLLPIDRNENWYVNCYLLIYIFSPFINILINKINKNKLKKIIIVSFIVFSLIGTLLIGDVILGYNNGRSIFTFLLLYFIGAYLKRYPIEESSLFSKFKPKMKKYIFLILWIIFAFIGAMIRITSLSVYNYGNSFYEIARVLEMMSISFLSPVVIIEAVSYFLFFKNMNFSSKIINFIGGTTFGIYLLHENIYIRENLFDWLDMGKHANGGIKLIGMIIVLGIIIFIACMIVEIIRKAIYKFFYKRKFAFKLRNKIKDFIKSLGLNINY